MRRIIPTIHKTGRYALLLVLAALALAAALAAVAQPAAALPGYVHGGADCDSCHTASPVPDSACTAAGCHATNFQARGTRTCYTCHDPGEDMSAVQAPAGCSTGAAGAACHNAAGHFGSNAAGCTTAGCHSTAGIANSNGSAHHTEDVYTAPTCTTCHTPLHETYIPGTTSCDSCHKGFETAHPAPASMVAPTFALVAKPAIVKYGLTTILSGSLKLGTTGVPGALVSLFSKPVGSTDFAFVAEATTGADGAYAFAALSPTLITTYRVVVPGAIVGPTNLKPGLKIATVKVVPVLTISLSRTKFLLGGKVTIKGKVTPVRPGGIVKLTLQRKIGGVWKTQLTKSRTLSATSLYSYTYKPLKRGSWRVKAYIGPTTQLAAFTTAYKTWVVK